MKDYEIRMHHCDEITHAELHLLMDPTKVEDVVERDPKPDDLMFSFKTFFYILVKTLCTITGAHDQGKITGVLHNTLYAISCELSSMWKIYDQDLV